jgi:transcription termination factor Rho
MSVESTEALERSVLEGKDREQLLAIAAALGVKATSRAKKADIIGKILEQTGSTVTADTPAATTPAPRAPRARNGSSNGNGRAKAGAIEAPPESDAAAAPVADEPVADDNAVAPAATESTLTLPLADVTPPAAPPVDTDGVAATEPMAEWELAIGAEIEPAANAGDHSDAHRDGGGDNRGATRTDEQAPSYRPGPGPGSPGGAPGDGTDGTGQSNRRRRRRNRDRNRADGPQGSDRINEGPPPSGQGQPYQPGQGQHGQGQPTQQGQGQPAQETFQGEPVAVAGFLDLRDEGYGFLRVNGYLPSRDDVYVSVKQTRQYGLRKGDHVTGMARPAGRNEKNPALLRIDTVNDQDPELARTRPKFEELTPLFPDEKLKLEGGDPNNMTARIVDLISPIGKGQRGLIVSPPKAGKTTIMKTIAMAIERNNPEVKLMVLLVDERPEEVTDMRRTVKGEVVASTFDRPSDEHTHVAEMAIERAKRLVEMGEDVVVILDGITRLSRAYNLAAPATGRIMSGGIDAGALYPPKKFFGAARNIEEGGSLTVLATALVETNSRMDDAIFEEFKGTGNMELRLDRKLAERRVYPAIDVDASSTRHEELLFDRKQLQMVWKLRRVLSGLAEGGSAEAGLNLLVDRLKTFRNNDEFLAEIAKQPSM